MTNQIEKIYNFLQLSDSIATSGQPTEEQFREIQASGYQLLINLALSDSTNALVNEQEIVEAKGMEYINIPVVWEHPTLKDIQEFFRVMQANTDKKIFVHCVANMRVSAFVYLYRLIYDHLSEEDAKQDLEKIWIPNPTWQQFIQRVREYYQK
ncbi:MAG: protein tyrosine phosphatase family protein [Coleofasciculaceae cyanobacterium]